MQKQLTIFLQNSVEEWHMGHRGHHWILVVIWTPYIQIRVKVSWGTDILLIV